MKARAGTSRSDEDLIGAYRAGDRAAADALIGRYAGLVYARARQFDFTAGVEASDLVQEGMIGLWEAIDGFEPGRAAFAGFAERCVLRKVLSAVRAAGRNKNRPINEGVPIEEGIFPGTQESPEEIYLAAERLSELKEAIASELSGREKKVFGLYLAGLSYGEISGKLMCGEKAVDNAIQRIRKKAAGVRARGLKIN